MRYSRTAQSLFDCFRLALSQLTPVPVVYRGSWDKHDDTTALFEFWIEQDETRHQVIEVDQDILSHIHKCCQDGLSDIDTYADAIAQLAVNMLRETHGSLRF